jgi:hypothetical protein
MSHSHLRTLRALLRAIPAAALLAACTGNADASADATTTGEAAIPPDAQDWRPLFDGQSLTGWHGHRTPDVVPTGWAVVDGAITRVGEGGDLVTAEQFANFELEFEWMVTSGGNSGVFYRINPDVEVTYMSAPEYQVLDDAVHADGQSPLTSAGAAFGLYPAPAGHAKAGGEWNAARIVVNGASVEHWLNGTQTASYALWSPEWEQKVRDSKFGAWPDYGRATRGHIGLQDHGDRVAFRNIRIRVLP